MGGLTEIFLLIAVVLFMVEAVRTRSLTAAGLAFLAGAFLIETGAVG